MAVGMFERLRRAFGSLRGKNGEADGPGHDDRVERMARVGAVVADGNALERGFVINEIVGDRCYERYGVEVKPGDTVIDAGANIGIAAAHFALNCEAGSIHSFEPVPATFALLATHLSGVPQCHAHQLGLGRVSGRRTMTSYPGDPVLSTIDPDEERVRAHLTQVAANWGVDPQKAEATQAERLVPETVECEFVRLSDFLRSEGMTRVDLLKIDVERAEVEVLDGIDEEHWSAIRQVAAEVHEKHLEAEMTRRLERKGFRVTCMQDPSLSGTPVKFLYATREGAQAVR